MANLKEHIPVASVSLVVGAVIPAMLSLGIFATRADLAELRADIAEKYVTRGQIEARLDKIEKAIEKLLERGYHGPQRENQ